MGHDYYGIPSSTTGDPRVLRDTLEYYYDYYGIPTSTAGYPRVLFAVLDHLGDTVSSNYESKEGHTVLHLLLFNEMLFGNYPTV